MWELTYELIKALIVEALKWGILALGGWLILNVAPITRSIAKKGIPRSMVITIIAAVTISGFLNGAITILYNDYQIARLGEWGQDPGPLDPKNVNGGYGPVTATCPKGSYVVGVRNYGNTAKPYCIGCFVAVQVLCRKLNN
ncbi:MULTISPECIES: hypothetical protein [Bradyrhizobium]|uniref:hypothetical protein n=1 Tax=Bradyrhizobium TaxID=374 RepID=UPI001008F318|nr:MULTISPECIES: hypothetical protein [Bradyrhizobium]MDA9399708.1 hypothetical protein [Bradyrhizobium sp. CCBAU 45389]MDA9433516.1 hypothetical protein [Bradyrhizobium sp. CCBAU 51627]MDA9531382.1 hypothetical protein [Bradyrhizobium sp. CCBAU 25338]RXH32317.1 hypothetical protein XH84_14025 [Bradyrhizobium nanningense]